MVAVSANRKVSRFGRMAQYAERGRSPLDSTAMELILVNSRDLRASRACNTASTRSTGAPGFLEDPRTNKCVKVGAKIGWGQEKIVWPSTLKRRELAFVKENLDNEDCCVIQSVIVRVAAGRGLIDGAVGCYCRWAEGKFRGRDNLPEVIDETALRLFPPYEPPTKAAQLRS